VSGVGVGVVVCVIVELFHSVVDCCSVGCWASDDPSVACVVDDDGASVLPADGDDVDVNDDDDDDEDEEEEEDDAGGDEEFEAWGCWLSVVFVWEDLCFSIILPQSKKPPPYSSCSPWLKIDSSESRIKA